jgi:adenosylcobinamide-GDP ribazoletransferase
MTFLKGFLLNLQFFTAVPISAVLPMEEKYLRSAIKSFPIVGLLQGALYSAFVYALIYWTPLSPLAIAFALWLMTIVVSGGIHLDGWMDASDAYFSYQNKEKRLEIMSDPRTGAFGVLSVIVLLSSRFLFIYEVTASMTVASYLLIMIIPFLSKGVMGAILVMIPTAKKEGLAALFQKAGNRRSLIVYPIYLVLVIIIFLLQGAEILFPIILLLLVALGCFLFIRGKSVKWFGGITGDVLGASVEGTELILWMTLWLLHYSAMG